MRILSLLVGVEIASDVIGIVVNPFGIDKEIKVWILTAVVVLSLVWSIGRILAMLVHHAPPATPPTPAPAAPPAIPVVAIVERTVRHVLMWDGVSVTFAAIILLLLWTSIGLPYLVLTWGIEIFLIIILITDLYSAYYVART